MSNRVTTFGDSITVGVGSSSSPNSWVGLAAPRNKAVSGSQAAEVSNAVQQITPEMCRTYTIMVGTNDHRQYKDDATKHGYFAAFLRQAIAWLTLPVKATPRGSGVSLTGTWASTVVNSFGMNTTQNGATAAATVNGTAVVIGYIIQNHANAHGEASVSIDGVQVGSINCFGAMTTVNGLTYAAAAVRFDGLTDGPHEVVVTVTSDGQIFYLNYIAGAPQASPDIRVSNVLRMSDAAYANYGTSHANVQAFNAIIDGVLSEFGMVAVDNYSAIVPSLHLSDGVHPNDAGHALISDAFLGTTL